MPRTVRIFLSSPGDVAAERAQVRDLLLGLARGPFVRGRVLIDVVSWDDPYAPAQMDARFTPQEAVNRSLPSPAECDLTIVLLWSWMGTPLTSKKADGTQYLSGTEWEFESALKSNRRVLLYRRSQKVLIDPDDANFDEKVAQKRKVDAFFNSFVDEGGAIHRSYKTYASSDELLKQVRLDVEQYLSTLLSEADEDGVRQGGEQAAAPRERMAGASYRTSDILAKGPYSPSDSDNNAVLRKPDEAEAPRPDIANLSVPDFARRMVETARSVDDLIDLGARLSTLRPAALFAYTRAAAQAIRSDPKLYATAHERIAEIYWTDGDRVRAEQHWAICRRFYDRTNDGAQTAAFLKRVQEVQAGTPEES